MTQHEKAERFQALHAREGAFVIPNPWDAGSARLLEGLGFEALATTSSGLANALGRLDGQVSREEKVAHCAALSAATGVPISADLAKCFADDPEQVARTEGRRRRAVEMLRESCGGGGGGEAERKKEARDWRWWRRRGGEGGGAS